MMPHHFVQINSIPLDLFPSCAVSFSTKIIRFYNPCLFVICLWLWLNEAVIWYQWLLICHQKVQLNMQHGVGL